MKKKDVEKADKLQKRFKKELRESNCQHDFKKNSVLPSVYLAVRKSELKEIQILADKDYKSEKYDECVYNAAENVIKNQKLIDLQPDICYEFTLKAPQDINPAVKAVDVVTTPVRRAVGIVVLLPLFLMYGPLIFMGGSD